MKDINLIPTDDLLDELQKRFAHMIFCGMKEDIKVSKAWNIYKQYFGNYTTCLGLCTEMEHYIIGDLEEENGINTANSD